MVATGSELSCNSSGNTHVSETSGAQCGADFVENDEFDADLERLVGAWRWLPDDVRHAIMALVSTAESNNP